MISITKQVPDSFNLFLFGDTHHGAIHTSEDGIDDLIDKMQSKYEGCKANYGVHHGDAIEAILVDDKRFQLDATDVEKATPIKQADFAVKKMMPIRDNIVAWLEGNHEFKLSRVLNMTRDYILKELGKPHIYGTETACITYVDKNGDVIFKHLAKHGSRQVKSIADDIHRREANKQLSLKRHLQDLMGDCLLQSMGHTHQLLICEPTDRLFIYEDNGKIKQGYVKAKEHGAWIHPDHRWYVNTGSFLKLYVEGFSGYAERRGFAPVQLGYAVVLVRDRTIQKINIERIQ